MTVHPGGAPGGPGRSAAPTRPKLEVAELALNAGRVLGTSRWTTVTMADIETFADATGDHQWIHVDAERASSGPFGEPVAHGYLVLTTIARLFPEILEITDRSMSVNYGTDEVRFISPVPAGSAVRLRGVLSGVEERTGGARLLRVSVELELEGSEEPAATAELLFLVTPTAPTAPTGAVPEVAVPEVAVPEVAGPGPSGADAVGVEDAERVEDHHLMK